MSQSTIWFDAMVAKGHYPKTYDGGGPDNLNFFAYDMGYHNGPGCETCGWSCCWHCEGVDSIPECTKPPLELSATSEEQVP